MYRIIISIITILSLSVNIEYIRHYGVKNFLIQFIFYGLISFLVGRSAPLEYIYIISYLFVLLLVLKYFLSFVFFKYSKLLKLSSCLDFIICFGFMTERITKENPKMYIMLPLSCFLALLSYVYRRNDLQTKSK